MNIFSELDQSEHEWYMYLLIKWHPATVNYLCSLTYWTFLNVTFSRFDISSLAGGISYTTSFPFLISTIASSWTSRPRSPCTPLPSTIFCIIIIIIMISKILNLMKKQVITIIKIVQLLIYHISVINAKFYE